MVNTHLYAPILKWKAAEKGALNYLTEAQKSNTVPLLEFVRPLKLTEKEIKDGIKSPEDKLINILSSSIPNDIALSWGDGRLFFADFTLIFPEDLRMEFAKTFCNSATKIHLNFIPVANLSADSGDYCKHITNLSMEHSNFRVCLRITCYEIQRVDSVNQRLDTFIQSHDYNKHKVSLLIDLKENVGFTTYDTAVKNIYSINDLDAYEKVILAGGAFPEDMTPYKIDAEINSETRHDWIGWSTHAKESSRSFPSYGDYTIRHPIYNESVLKHTPSTTIKYTVPDQWRFFTSRARSNVDYLTNAQSLRKLPDYLQYGANFSYGDRYIDEKGLYCAEHLILQQKNPGVKIPGAGRTEDWLRAGINHHIAVVVDQLSRLHD